MDLTDKIKETLEYMHKRALEPRPLTIPAAAVLYMSDDNIKALYRGRQEINIMCFGVEQTDKLRTRLKSLGLK